MNQGQHLSTSDYDLLLLHALSDDEQQRIERHLADCQRCRVDQEGYAADARRFSQEVLARAVSLLPQASQESFLHRLFRRRVVWVLAPAVMAAFALVVAHGKRVEPGRGEEGSTAADVRIKGGEPTLRSFARRMQHVFAVHDGMELHAGDELRFVVDSPALPFLLLVSVDGAGRINVYFPYDGSQSGTIATGKPTELPGSIVLDNAPGPERIFALYSKTPLLRADLESALRELYRQGPAAIRGKASLPVKAERQITLLFEKAAP